MPPRGEPDTCKMPDNTTPATPVEWTGEDETSLRSIFAFENIEARTQFLQARIESTKPSCTTAVKVDAAVTTRASVAEQELERTFSVQPTAVSALEYLSDVAAQQQPLQTCTSATQPRASLWAKYNASPDAETSKSAPSCTTAFVSVWTRYDSADTTPLSRPAVPQALAEWKLHCAYGRWLSERDANVDDPTRSTQLYDSLEATRIALYDSHSHGHRL